MSRWRLLAQHLGLAAAACLLLVAAYGIGGQQPRPAWFAAAALAGGLMSLALRRLGTGIPVTRWPQRTTVTGLSTRPGDSRTIFMAVRMQHGTRDRPVGIFDRRTGEEPDPGHGWPRCAVNPAGSVHYDKSRTRAE